MHPDDNREKFDANLEKCIVIGYLFEKKAYKCFNPLTRVVRVSRDVIFDESTSWYKPDSTPSDPLKEELNANSDDNIRSNPLLKDNPSSTEQTGPHEPSQTKARCGQVRNRTKAKVRCPNTKSRTTPTTMIRMDRLPH